MATLFAIVTVALVSAFGLLPDTADVTAIDAGGDSDDEADADQASAGPIDGPEDDGAADTLDDALAARPRSTATTEQPPEPVSQPMRYELALSELAIHDAVNGGRSDDEPEEAPSSPTTSAPATTAIPSTTAAPNPSSETSAPAEEPTTTMADGTDTSDSTGTTETTVPGDTTSSEVTETTAAATATTAHPDGFVDAGHGVFVPVVLLDIRYCESRDNYTAANPSSSARGAYQFLTGSWESYGHAARYGVAQAHLATPAQQDEAALITWQRDGTRPWNASSYCWS
ncbi:MAG: transglycosylase family protein [Acidimicrobiia bacterium]|nr:transglycosylase family protein [Acidimicrobiia bacterium]